MTISDATPMTIEDLDLIDLDNPRNFGNFEEPEDFGNDVQAGFTPTSLKTKVTKYITEQMYYPHIELDLTNGITGLDLKSLGGSITQQNLPGFNLFLKLPDGLFDIGILPKVSIQSFLEKFGEERVAYHQSESKIFRGRMITALNP